MQDEKTARANEVFASLCQMLDERDWKYSKEEDQLRVNGVIHGEDIPIEFIMLVEKDMEFVQFLSILPFEVPEDKRAEMAIAVCAANYGFANGSFDFNVMGSGKLIFRLTTSYRGDSKLSADLFEYMLLVAAMSTDKYNDKFFLLSKGNITLQQFLSDIAN